jgi:murein DD-endopeptidase MepM/ murein hydrolase activator NlpD
VVVIDHGLEIFSVYGHLSKISVQKGDLVNQGDILGLSGMTGRVSGPHLHWGVRIQGHWVDGFSLVEQSRLSSDNEH